MKCNMMWQMQCNKWSVTNAMWQMQCDKYRVIRGNWQKLSASFSAYEASLWLRQVAKFPWYMYILIIGFQKFKTYFNNFQYLGVFVALNTKKGPVLFRECFLTTAPNLQIVSFLENISQEGVSYILSHDSVEKNMKRNFFGNFWTLKRPKMTIFGVQSEFKGFESH